MNDKYQNYKICNSKIKSKRILIKPMKYADNQTINENNKKLKKYFLKTRNKIKDNILNLFNSKYILIIIHYNSLYYKIYQQKNYNNK